MVWTPGDVSATWVAWVHFLRGTLVYSAGNTHVRKLSPVSHEQGTCVPHPGPGMRRNPQKRTRHLSGEITDYARNTQDRMRHLSGKIMNYAHATSRSAQMPHASTLSTRSRTAVWSNGLTANAVQDVDAVRQLACIHTCVSKQQGLQYGNQQATSGTPVRQVKPY